MAERITKNMELVGKSRNILDGFDVPNDIQRKIARRSGALAGLAISHDEIVRVVMDNMSSSGIPNWNNIVADLGDMTTRAYQGKPIHANDISN